MLTLAACGTAPPSSATLTPAVPAQWPTLPTTADASEAKQAWWRRLQDAQLLALQEQAQQANADIGRALLRWQRAGLLVDQGRLAQNLQPSVGLSTSANRPLQSQSSTSQVQVGGVTVPVTTSAGITKSFGLSAGARYEVDLWSRLAEGSRADLADAEGARADVDAARWLISTQVAERYWSVAAIDAQLPLAREQLTNAEQALALTRLRLENAKLLPWDVDKASSAVQDAATRLASLELDRQQHRQALAVLTGADLPGPSLAQAHLPAQALPDWQIGPPERVLEQRPDVRKARLAVDAALHRSKVTEAERYPQLSLSAGVSTGGSAWRDWLSQPLGSLAAGLTVPLIDWRRLNLNRDLARTDLELAALSLRDSLTIAIADIETQFGERSRAQSALQASLAHGAEARRAERIARLRYEVGTLGRLDWLQARNASLAAEQDRIGLELKSWINMLALSKALGGPV